MSDADAGAPEGDTIGNRVAVLAVEGDVDAHVVEAYYERASSLLVPGVGALVVDLARAELVDSSAIALLVRIHNLAAVDGIGVRLRNLRPRVLRTLELAGMVGYLPIESADAGEAAS